MAGIKRKSATDGPKAAKPSADKKRKVAVRSGKVSTHTKSPSKQKPSKATLPKRQDSPSSDLVESDTSESGSEPGFFGFSAKEDPASGEEDAPVEKNEKTAPKKPLPKSDKLKNGTKAKVENAAPATTTSKEAHAKQKVLVKERKAAKPNADSIQRSKQIWERLRRKSHVPKEERRTLVDELFGIITGRVKDFVFKHDSVRVVQCALKYANPEQRKAIAVELKGEFKTLAESKYAKFLIGKMLVEGREETRDIIVPEFYGHVKRLINHPEAAWILDDMYRGIATPHQKAIFLREWYGPEFAIFRSSESEKPVSYLADVLAQAPEKRNTIMNHLRGIINQLIQKKLTGFTMLHDAMLQYFENTRPGSEEVTDFIELLKSDEEFDLLKNLAFTPSGARTVCLALAHGTAKDRRHFLRAYKDIMEMMAFDAHGYSILLAAYDLVDDTVLLAKSIFPELIGKITASSTPEQQEQQYDKVVALAEHVTGRLTVLYPLVGCTARWLFPPTGRYSVLAPKLLDIRETTSKKNPATRRAELIAAIGPTLVNTIAARAAVLTQSSFGCQFIAEVLLAVPPATESDKDDAGIGYDKQAALVALAALCTASPVAEETHVANAPHGARMLKTLAMGGRFDADERRVVKIEPPLGFASLLWDAMRDNVLDWASGTAAFVVVGLLEGGNLSDEAMHEVLDILRKGKARLEEAIKQWGEEHAAREAEKRRREALVREGKIEPEKRKPMKSGPGSDPAGIRLLLKKLQKEQK